MPKPASSSGLSNSACESLVRLSKGIELKIKLDDYTDKEWCADLKVDEDLGHILTTDEYFLWVLCWGPYGEKRLKSVWEKVQACYDGIGKPPLYKLAPTDTKKLRELYPIKWQKKWLSNLVNYLKEEQLSTRNLVSKLRKEGYEEARKQLQGIVSPEVEEPAEKIVDCWLRDVVKIDALPIDSRIRSLFEKYKIPDDSDFVIKCCKQNDIPVREFARMVYENAEAMSNPSVAKT